MASAAASLADALDELPLPESPPPPPQRRRFAQSTRRATDPPMRGSVALACAAPPSRALPPPNVEAAVHAAVQPSGPASAAAPGSAAEHVASAAEANCQRQFCLRRIGVMRKEASDALRAATAAWDALDASEVAELRALLAGHYEPPLPRKRRARPRPCPPDLLGGVDSPSPPAARVAGVAALVAAPIRAAQLAIDKAEVKAHCLAACEAAERLRYSFRVAEEHPWCYLPHGDCTETRCSVAARPGN